MLYEDQESFNQFYLHIANSNSIEISREIIQYTNNFISKMITEIKQYDNFNNKMRLINENIFQFYCQLNCFITVFLPNNSIKFILLNIIFNIIFLVNF
jgi:hypothetical protein